MYGTSLTREPGIAAGLEGLVGELVDLASVELSRFLCQVNTQTHGQHKIYCKQE